MSLKGKAWKNYSSIFAVCIVAIYGVREVVSIHTGRCPDWSMLNNLQQAFNQRRMELLELYCRKRNQIDGTPIYKCAPVICLAKSHYQAIWQLADKNFPKRLYTEIVLLEKARQSLRILIRQLEKDQKSSFKILRNSIENDMVAINYVMQVCYHLSPNEYPDIKKSMGGDFLTFPLSKEKATACSSGGQWQQLTFTAELIQLYNDMYDSIVDFKSE